MRHLRQHGTRKTPQSERIPGREDMRQNNAGGYAWAVDDWMLMQRFLILGTEAGTYYVGEKILTRDSCEATMWCIEEDGPRAVDLIVEISDKGRAAKNDYALFALAMASAAESRDTRKMALEALPKVARIGTHLLHFVSYMEQFRGWGRLARETIARWFNDKEPDDLAYQVVKYQQRDGFSQHDLLRLAKPLPASVGHDSVFAWIAGKLDDKKSENLPRIIRGYEKAKSASNTTEMAQLIREYNLPRECIPTGFLNEAAVWGALLERMPMTAMIRNLGNMSKNGLLVRGNFDASSKVVSKLTDAEAIVKARIHPLTILAAQITYKSGRGFRGSGTWVPIGDVLDALDQAFYAAFDTVVPTNKRICIGLDVSGSMSSGNINGIPGMTPRTGACCMSMVTYRTEPNVAVMAFCDSFMPIDMSRRRRLDDLVAHTDGLPFGGTDCALPMLWALEKHKTAGVVFDAFIVYTDSETWYGDIHPKQALDTYRREVNPEARLVVVGMVANDVSIADPTDPAMLDVVGFDTATPNLISQFLRGEI